MTRIVNRKSVLEKMNDAISNATFAAIIAMTIVLGLVSISGIIENPQNIKEIATLLQSSVYIGSVMNVDFSSF